MSIVDKAALALTQCYKCLGCNRLEDESFRGNDTCTNFRKADAATLVQRRYREENEPADGTWRPR